MPPANVFVAVPNDLFAHAALAKGPYCSVDQVNYQAAQGAAVDHFGPAEFIGWVGDIVTGEVPSVLWVELDGAQDFYVKAATGVARPDVAAVWHHPTLARSGFDVVAYLAGIPVGEYQVAIYYRMQGKMLKCPAHVTVSVQ